MQPVHFKNKAKDTCGIKCCVQGCNIKSANSLSVRFHRFPTANSRFVFRENLFGAKEKIDLLDAWKTALRISCVSSHMVVCSQHFTSEDYNFPDIESIRRTLKRTAVPSLNLPTTAKQQAQTKKSFERLGRRSRRSLKPIKCLSDTSNTVLEEKNESELINCSIDQDLSENNEVYLENYDTPLVDMKIDVGTQTDFENLSRRNNEQSNSPSTNSDLSFVNLIKTDSDLSTATGIESFNVLDEIVRIVKLVHGERFESENIKMKTRDRIIMVYVKLKQNLSYSLLAIMFNTYTAKHCQRVFEEMIQVLSGVLKAVIPWPSKDQIASNLPKCFKGFEDTRVVLDCTEVFIQHPKEACCQVLTYSYYKSHATCKIMTGVSPSGTITFVSKVYGGRVSDSAIFEQSSLVKLLDPGDAIMVDRGFLIDELCELNRWKCIRPPFLKDKHQFSKEESLYTSKIAAARVHVERSNQRIKTFKIVGSVLPGNLVPLLEDIFIVLCATINMSSPIMKDNKFLQDE